MNKISNAKKQIDKSNVITIEDILKNMEGSVMSLKELKRKTKGMNPKKTMSILKDLEKNNKIFIGSKGITWIYNPQLNLKKSLSKSIEIIK